MPRFQRSPSSPRSATASSIPADDLSVDRWFPFAPQVGSEQAGNRLALVVSGEVFNRSMTVLTVPPITTRREGRSVYPNEALPAVIQSEVEHREGRNMPRRSGNLAALALLKWVHCQHDAEGNECEVRYFRDADGREVDFVISQARLLDTLV